MFTLTSFDDIAGIAQGVEITNPNMVERIRRAADSLNRHEIAAHLGQAITEATDAAHVRDFEEVQRRAPMRSSIANITKISPQPGR